jgi:5'-methylthioadenosine phosphorylase
MAEDIHIGIIGGSGLYKMQGVELVREVSVDTPFGPPSDAILVTKIEGIPVAFLSRHGRGHVHAPTEVPYRANIYALKKMGVSTIISVSACGSLREHLEPGHFVIPDQVFDFTNQRARSFFGDGWVAHISAADPYCSTLSSEVANAVEEAGGTTHRGGQFITIEGPRFSTKSESRVFRSWGMDIIGMTASPEVFLAREAGICYATIAHITDYDVWHEAESPVTVEMVVRQLQTNVKIAQEAIRALVPDLDSLNLEACECRNALKNASITDPDKIPEETQEKLNLLTRGQG